MFMSKLAKKFKKAATNTMTTAFSANDVATLFMVQKNKFNNYNVKH